MGRTKSLIRSGRGSTSISNIGTISFVGEVAIDTLNTDHENTQWYRYLKFKCKQISGWWSVTLEAKKIKLQYEPGGWFSTSSVSIPKQSYQYALETVTEIEAESGEYEELDAAIRETYQELVDHLKERMETETEIQEMEEEAQDKLEAVLSDLDIDQIPDYREL